MTEPDPRSRRPTLLGVKLKALVAEHVGRPITAEVEQLPDGAALLDGTAAWVLIDGDASRALGRALAWAVRRAATSLDIVVEAGGGVVARRGAAFDMPITVWTAVGRELAPVVADPLVPPPPPAADHLAWMPMIERAGAIANVEHGVVFGEVSGLEVCRVVDEPTAGFFAEPGVDPILRVQAVEGDGHGARPRGGYLEVGVGAADREAFQMMHGDVPTPQALAHVVDVVARHRSEAAGRHPLNRLGRERALRWLAMRSPHLVGLVDLAPAEPPVPRPNLSDPVPCVAIGHDADGAEVTVVFSTGVDLELLPFVADVQAMSDRRIIVALPARDLLPVTREIAARLARRPELVALDA